MPGRFFIDPAPLRESRQFRLLFSGQVISQLGSQLTVVAIPYLVYNETHSSFQVGAVSLVQLVPLVVGALVGGSVGDAVDRRTMLGVTSVLLAVTSTGLAVNAATDKSLVVIYVVSAIAAGLTGFLSTAGNAAVATLVERRDLAAAYSFVQVTHQLGTVVGPALSGVLIAVVGVTWVFAIDAGTYLVALVTILLMDPIPPVEGSTRPGLRSFTEGLAFLKTRQALQGVYLIDLNAMIFGMPRALFPALAANVFHGGSTTLGILYSAPGAGALVGAVTTGWVNRVRRQSWVIVAAVVGWGAAIAAFGFARALAVALVLLAVAGWADVISAVVRSTVLHSSVPERFRSRMSSIQMAVVQGGPRLGDLESGVVADVVSTQFSVVFGGLASIVGALALVAALPGFRNYRAGPPGHDEGDEPEPPLLSDEPAR